MWLIIYLNIFKPHCLFSILLGFWWHKDLNFCYSTHRSLRFCSFFFSVHFHSVLSISILYCSESIVLCSIFRFFPLPFFYAIKPINFKILVILSSILKFLYGSFLYLLIFFPLSVVFLLHCWDFLFFFNYFKLVETFLWCLL